MANYNSPSREFQESRSCGDQGKECLSNWAIGYMLTVSVIRESSKFDRMVNAANFGTLVVTLSWVRPSVYSGTGYINVLSYILFLVLLTFNALVDGLV